MDGIPRAEAALTTLYGALQARLRSPGDLRRLGGALKNLQRGLTGDRTLAGSGYFSTRDFLDIYLLYYWPVSFMQASYALEELARRGVLPEIRTVLDLGAGPGPASFAAFARGAESSLLLDGSAEALRFAADLSESTGFGKVRTETKDLENVLALHHGPFDLIVASHSINELWKSLPDAVERRAALVLAAVDSLAPGGVLLVLEPSASATAIPALKVRDRVLSLGAGGGLRCLGPCLDSSPCPAIRAGEGRSCHSTWPWKPLPFVERLAAHAGLDRDSVKSTWFALGRGTLPRSSDAVDARNGLEEANSLRGRIISEAMLNKAGRIRYIACTGPDLATVSAKSGDPSTAASGFPSLARGDIVGLENLERREGDRSFGLLQSSGMRRELSIREFAAQAARGEA